MSGAVLTLNAGSSSIKFALYAIGEADPRIMVRGQIEQIPCSPHLRAVDDHGAVLIDRRSGPGMSHEDLLGGLLDWIEAHLGEESLSVAGHRVVHGGAHFSAPLLVDDEIMAQLVELEPLAPLHQPHNLAAIRAVRAIRPKLPQVACFDTAFHHGQAEVVTRIAVPRDLAALGVRRYGFHGLSYDYIARQLKILTPKLANGKVIVAHLGNGASLCAIESGKSVETTMGFTALDGLIMGTRCGSIDPGVLLFLLQQRGLSAAALSDLLYSHSGLLGLSGESGDMRVLLDSPTPAAAQAVESFVYHIVTEMGALTAALGGLDGIVFTAGIGEHAPRIRSLVAAKLGWLGGLIDEARNQQGAGRISADDSRLAIWVIPTDEEAMIARHSLALLSLS